MIQDKLNEIETLIRARYSVIYLVTHEEHRIETLMWPPPRADHRGTGLIQPSGGVRAAPPFHQHAVAAPHRRW